MRIVISGTRTFDNANFIEQRLSGEIGSGDLVITGGCRGVDTIAHDWARRMFCDTKVMPADWDKHGKAAGPIRNKEMLEDADLLIAFWDGKSRGTRDAIRQATLLRVDTRIIYVEPNNG